MKHLAIIIGAAGALAFAAPSLARDASAALAERTAQSDLPLEGARAAMQLPHVALSIAVDPSTRSIIGDARLQVLATAPLNEVALDLDPRFRISVVRVDGVQMDRSAFANPAGLLTIQLPQPLAAGEQVEVQIGYDGVPHEAINAPWEGGFVWSETEDGLPWIATAVQGEGCDLFWPCIDHSSVRIGTIDLVVTVPQGLVAAGNGTLISALDAGAAGTAFHWRARDPSNYGVALNIGPYELAERTYQSRFGNSIPMMFWHLPGNAEEAERLLEEMASYLDFFESTIGPYPFGDEKVGVAETPHLGMEHQTINAYGNGFARDPLGYDWLLFHEFGHEWFANQLTNATVNHMWLHEGLGTYVQPLYLGWLRGEMLFDAEMWRYRQQIASRVPLVPPEGTLPDYMDAEAAWGTDIYYKGAWVAHSLRYLVGDEAFFAALTRLTYGSADPQPGSITPVLRTTDDLRLILETSTGEDLGWFFDAYLYQAALPELVVTREGQWLELAWQSPSASVFAMPVDLLVDGELRHVSMPEGRVRIDLGHAGSHVLIDPENRILRRDLAIEAWQAEEAAEESGT